jgi:hypothetical protein
VDKKILGTIVPAILGLFSGLLITQFNSNVSDNRYFMEKKAKAADDVAVEFSVYIENWDRLIRLRKVLDSRTDEPSVEERENFKKVVFNRSDARDKLFSALDSTLLYYDEPTSNLALQFKSWDNQQVSLTSNQLPSIDEWRNWQIKILRQIHKEIKK